MAGQADSTETNERPALRKRWEIYVTAEERALITDGARRARLSIADYLVALASKSQIVVRTDWATGVDRLVEVSRLLAELSQRMDALQDPLDRMEATAQLLSIERRIEAMASPWLTEGDGC